MDESDSSPQPRAKRQKTSHKTAVFDRLKELKGKGSKNKYEVSNVDNVYELLDEREYSKKVGERQEDDWIVDDDGSGYVEDGREIFDYDEGESVPSTSKAKEKKRKNVSKPGAKGDIRSMISKMPEKKENTKINLEDDEAINEILADLMEPDSKKPKPTKKAPLPFINEEKLEVNNYMNSFSAPKPSKIRLSKSAVKSIRKQKPKKEDDDELLDNSIIDTEEPMDIETSPKKIQDEDSPKKPQNILHEVNTLEDKLEDKDMISNMFDDDFNIDDFDMADSQKENLAVKNEVSEEFLLSGKGFDAADFDIPNETITNVKLDSQLPLTTNSDNEPVFRFYYWDAFENEYKLPGVVFLLGKVYAESTKSYVSCCVVVRKIERRIYLLPRTTKKNTEESVKIVDVYNEFNDVCAEDLGAKKFRSRVVTKKYAFDEQVPAQSQYLEVRYSAECKKPPNDFNGNTFSRAFGINTSFLEILLIEKKIKGPGWIDIKDPQPVQNPLSWCQFEINCEQKNLFIVVDQQKVPPPPLTVATLNIRTALNKNLKDEIIMISCLVNNKYHVDKPIPKQQFQRHFCFITKPPNNVLPYDFHEALRTYKGTKVQKCDTEKAMLQLFLKSFAEIDPDLVIGYELMDYHFGLLCTRLHETKAAQWSRFGKLKRSNIPIKTHAQKDLMVGRLVCDLKVSAKELIKSRSYELDALCETVLKLKEGERPSLQPGDIIKMFNTSEYLIKLISLTMQDAAYITKMMYELNVMPLALQITNIAGNVLSKTLRGGRSGRNEYLLLHAFYEKDFIAPDVTYTKFSEEKTRPAKKKATYSGGLVLEPKVGFYDKLILLMDFNSLYPSIIQEYNICFTTIQSGVDPELLAPDGKQTGAGILPTEIRKLVESRREVKKLMASPDISPDLRMQYNIRQLALKLTANSMYGCLGFAHSRFFAKHLASLVTLKGRDILMHTRDLVQTMGYEVIYGDTDSIMINTNSTDYDQVFKIGSSIKQAVNKSYRQVELEIDGVFKYMLLLKKKKYAAVTIAKNKSGEITLKQEHKGLDIVRRDWSMLASEVGKMVLNHLLSDQTTDERLENVQTVLRKIADDLQTGKVPLALLTITKQLTKDPHMYNDKTVLSHVMVAQRFNKKGGKPLGHGDTVPYVICDDGTNASSTQRAYHVEEFKTSDQLKIDINYYLSQQIHPVVSRLCEPIEGLDAYQIANSLGIDASSFKKTKPKPAQIDQLNISVIQKTYSHSEPFTFTCQGCKEQNTIKSMVVTRPSGSYLWLEKCNNDNCLLRPVEYLSSIQNQMTQCIRNFIQKYYQKTLVCEDPICPNEITALPLKFSHKYPVCTLCQSGVMYRKYNEKELYEQLCYYKQLCDLSKLEKKTYDVLIENGYTTLLANVNNFLKQSNYAVINLDKLFKEFNIFNRSKSEPKLIAYASSEEEEEASDDE